jgi:hypothetical protein
MKVGAHQERLSLTYEPTIPVLFEHFGVATETNVLLAFLCLAAFLMLTPLLQPAEAQKIVGPSSEVRITIVDGDLNANPLDVDRYEDREFVSFRTSRDEVGEARPEIVETGSSTGVFEFTIQLKTDARACELNLLDKEFEATGGSDPSVGTCPGDLLMVEYEDETTTTGQLDRVDYVFEVASWDPEFVAEEPSYEAGDVVTVNVFDPDADRNPDIPDSLRDLRVFSDSDPVGRQLSAIETGTNTGTFRLSFTTAAESQGNSLVVKQGDELTVEYTDDFPADFATSEENKKFSFVMIFGASSGNIVILSSPLIRNAAGETVTELHVGQQVVASTELANSMINVRTPFIVMMEIRDSIGITVSLGWQAGILDPADMTGTGLSWTPAFSGVYESRVYVVSSLSNPQLLSSVMTSELTVIGN